MKSTVTVQGTGVAAAQPDEVRILIEVSAQRPKPEAALAEVAGSSEALVQIFDGLDIPQSSRTTSGASVSDVWEYDKQGNRSQAGYRAFNSVVVRLTDASILGKLMNQATEQAGARIQGPWWHIAEDNPARALACEKAAAAARQKAEAYAAALGVRISGVDKVIEPGSRPVMETATRMMMAGAPEPEVTVSAGELEVSATVEVKFRIDPI